MIRGCLLTSYSAKLGEDRRAIINLVAEGKIVYDEHVEHGIENVLPAFMRLFDGTNEYQGE